MKFSGPFQWRLFRAKLDPVVGGEEARERPVLVVSHEAVNGALPIVTVLPLTTLKPGRHIYPSEVLLKASDPHDLEGPPRAILWGDRG